MRKNINTLNIILSLALIISSITIGVLNGVESVKASASAEVETEICEEPEQVEFIDVSELETHEWVLSDTKDLDELSALVDECQRYCDDATTIKAAALDMGYDESHPVVQFAEQEYEVANEYKEIYQTRYNSIQEKWETYPVAMQVYSQLSAKGYSDYVIAGIVGNMMTECGGNTLDLDPTVYSETKHYYGLCQWSGKYYDDVFGASTTGQITYLTNNIEEEFDTFGNKYKLGFTYSDFLNLTDEQEAAKAFAAVYERCGYTTRGQRAKNATTAYQFFVSQ